MDSWRFESNTGKQTALSLACMVVGIVLAIGFRNFSGPGLSNSFAGFLLGILLLIIGISAFWKRGKQTITVDTRARTILVENSNPLSANRRLIAFDEITDIGIGYLGKKSNYVSFYYLILKLRNGENYPLFSPGYFFEGGSDKSVMETRRQRLEECMKL